MAMIGIGNRKPRKKQRPSLVEQSPVFNQETTAGMTDEELADTMARDDYMQRQQRPAPIGQMTQQFGPPVQEEPEAPEDIAQKSRQLGIKNPAETAGPKQLKTDQVLKQATAGIPEKKAKPEEDPFMADIQTKRDELSRKIDEAKKVYEQNKDRIAWAEVAETIGHALIQLGAGAHGLRTGTDLSGIKFNKANWDAKYNRALREFDGKMEGLRGEARGLERREETEIGRRERRAEAERGREFRREEAEVGREFRAEEAEKKAELERELLEKRLHADNIKLEKQLEGKDRASQQKILSKHVVDKQKELDQLSGDLAVLRDPAAHSKDTESKAIQRTAKYLKDAKVEPRGWTGWLRGKPSEDEQKIQQLESYLQAETQRLQRLRGGGQQAAQPQQKTEPQQQVSPQDRGAMQWLEANPNDPRADAIRKRLQQKGLL